MFRMLRNKADDFEFGLPVLCNSESNPGDEVDSSQQPLLFAVLSKARKKKYDERKYQLELREQSVTLSLFETNPRYFKRGGKYALGLR